jgi:hypothetical protein
LAATIDRNSVLALHHGEMGATVIALQLGIVLSLLVIKFLMESLQNSEKNRTISLICLSALTFPVPPIAQNYQKSDLMEDGDVITGNST